MKIREKKIPMLKQNLPIFMLVSKRNVSNFAGGVSTIKKSNVSALFLHNKEKKLSSYHQLYSLSPQFKWFLLSQYYIYLSKVL